MEIHFKISEGLTDEQIRRLRYDFIVSFKNCLC